MSRSRLCVVLLSGGLDSCTAAAMVRARGFRLIALTVSYGQRHAVELAAARRVARFLGVVEHIFLDVDLRTWGGSALTARMAVPKSRRRVSSSIPSTYVPARNTILLALALALAEARGAADIIIGVNALDYSGYPDCRPAFVRAFERTARLATKAGVEGRIRFRVHAPLIRMTKAQIIRAGMALGCDYSLTWSCYDPVRTPAGRYRPCGRCDSCRLRAKGFREAGIPDPALETRIRC